LATRLPKRLVMAVRRRTVSGVMDGHPPATSQMKALPSQPAASSRGSQDFQAATA
jgi:hypothetical protein